MPTRKSRSSGTISAPAMTAAMMISTYGVERVGCSRPSALGIWRLRDSEYANRDNPSIAELAAAIRVAVAAIEIVYLKKSATHVVGKDSAIPSTGASR